VRAGEDVARATTWLVQQRKLQINYSRRRGRRNWSKEWADLRGKGRKTARRS